MRIGVWMLRRTPFFTIAGWLLWEAGRGELRLDLAHLLGAGLLGVAWLAGRVLWSPALLAALLLIPLLNHFALERPRATRALTRNMSGGAPYLRVEGTVRGRAPGDADSSGAHSSGADSRGRVYLLLGDARLWVREESFHLAELAVNLPAKSVWAFPHRRRVRIGGVVAGPDAAGRDGAGRLLVTFRKAEHHQRGTDGLWRAEALRVRLRDRAAYYLSPQALAVYLPVLLGMRERTTPEARQVAKAFRRVGVAHLFAISGLHVGLLYFILAAARDGALRWLRWGLWRGRWAGQGWVHTPAAGRLAVLAVIWGYIALIGFPLPAVRAAAMGSMLVWNEMWGTRSPPLYILSLAALGVLAFDPSQVYDISFQLSFLAYFFLLCALALHRPLASRPLAASLYTRREGGGAGRLRAVVVEGTLLNLWMTLVITLGLWPLVAAVFGTVSLLVFMGNLVMIPLLSLAVLPLGLAALAISLLHLQAAPGGWAERLVFGVLDGALSVWIWVVEALEQVGGRLVFPLSLEWSPREFILYYGSLLGLIWLLLRHQRRFMAARKGDPA